MSIKSKDVPEDVLMVGICGLDGVGKSTMAKAIYNELCYRFKRKSFLDIVGEVSKDPHGLLDLQQQLLCDISPRGGPKISTLDQGIIVLQRMLHREKVLLVIDGVNAKEQLEKLAGGHDWFAQGSRIFITSRDRSLLEHKVDELYELPGLNGSSLALKVLGNFLSNKQHNEWESEFCNLGKEPNVEILDVLKVGMHNLIQKLGHKIVRDESLRDKGIRSRLWHHIDVQDVLEERMKGTKSIEGIFLDLSKLDNINLSTQAMTDMTQLRLLKIFLGSEVVSGEEDCKVCITSDFKFPSGNLCYLYWHGYPSNSLPSNFDPAKLVELNMPYSNIRKFGLGNMVSNLTAIILSHSKCLIMVSNFSSTPNLEKLILEGCTSLREIDPSIGDLKRLGLLDLKECKSLGSLPDSICNLTSLKTLYLSGCSELNGWAKYLGEMTHLTELYANRTATGAPPSAIGERAYPPLSSLSGLCLLRELDLSDCYWWDEEIPYHFWGLYSLEKLNLSGSPITMVPASIEASIRLKVLVLGRCKRLQSLPKKLPPSLQELDAHECVSLSYVVEKHAPESQFCILVPGDKVPAWFDFHRGGSSVAIHSSGNFLGIWVCFVFAFKDQLPQIHDDISCRLNNFSFFYSYRDKWSGAHSSNRHMWLAYQPCSAFDICLPERWRDIEASFELSGVTDASEIECGIHLIYKQHPTRDAPFGIE
ncbi:Disease resistance protein RML1B [Vitis vinifera]|uniref:ADP-ribosyl cyclase/cyclic ADP-ribose hydrolase n=1 Tax=Vitis vinifera TaxID=29760 RepID=A0A438CIY6_VITVI|nr:Disease resistance protein RML1B [Vitis vinifera]